MKSVRTLMKSVRTLMKSVRTLMKSVCTLTKVHVVFEMVYGNLVKKCGFWIMTQYPPGGAWVVFPGAVSKGLIEVTLSEVEAFFIPFSHFNYAQCDVPSTFETNS